MRLFKIIILFLLATSCSSNNSETTSEIQNYNRYCQACHGKAGDLMVGGAANLTISNLNFEEVKTTITLGRGNMLGFEKVFSAEEIIALSNYVISLRN